MSQRWLSYSMIFKVVLSYQLLKVSSLSLPQLIPSKVSSGVAQLTIRPLDSYSPSGGLAHLLSRLLLILLAFAASFEPSLQCILPFITTHTRVLDVAHYNLFACPNSFRRKNRPPSSIFDFEAYVQLTRLA
jgi:hypothetical protein